MPDATPTPAPTSISTHASAPNSITLKDWPEPIMHAIYLGLARTIYTYGVCTVFLAGRSPNIRSYTVYVYGSGQPYIYSVFNAQVIRQIRFWPTLSLCPHHYAQLSSCTHHAHIMHTSCPHIMHSYHYAHNMHTSCTHHAHIMPTHYAQLSLCPHHYAQLHPHPLPNTCIHTSNLVYL